MVCETKIVADEHDAIPGTKKESMMWSSPASSAALNPAEAKDVRRDEVFIREFERGDQGEVRRIFCEGILERIPNTAFRGLRQQPRTQFLYALLTVGFRLFEDLLLDPSHPTHSLTLLRPQ
ncbi:unnamed protein product [Pleuronectes platessa]|uniref:Uncharacterized protein n=1 Tax=Pleuronectes platessa TaxID=8262 RepID=A0A9N7U0E4_PLEPL|nr:unnamed protein product [Pleuronectes platessa]